MKIGVIGTGVMGSAIARKLLQGGHEVTVWNRNPARADPLVAEGAIRVGRAAEAMAGEVLLTTLFDDVAVRSVLMVDRGLRQAKPGLLHAVLSTISFHLSQELDEQHRQLGLRYAAAPMFGRPEAVAAERLSLVTAGESKVLDDLEPVLSSLGKTSRFSARPAEAHLAKIVGNFLIASAVQSMAEASAVCGLNDADATSLLDRVTEMLFAGPVYRSYAPGVAAHRDAGPRLPATLFAKDLGLFMDAAGSARLGFPVAFATQERVRSASGKEFAANDWSVAVAKIARSRAGLPP